MEKESMTDQPAEDVHDTPTFDPPHRGWVGAAVAGTATVAVLQGLSWGGALDNGPLHHWYLQAALAMAVIGGYELVERLVARAYRRR